ncbi:DUF7457 domain-containing protein [Mycobacterium paragordonae]|uniref:Uncharacterized protein n=1 Tax=Mycobacterium paragordonae TaxID=1389713 RepID=A0AAJ1S2I6_9MYCO|nr:hypothetical protein [Mycobacterium paragordonae]MDP7733659.1 hypothetical protein [Mycobacterium paragordonae]
MDIQPFSKTTLGKMAACEAVGLSYWSDHPANGCVWAVDSDQQAHVVRWYRNTNEASLQSVGKPYKVVDYSKPGLAYKDHFPTHDSGDRVKVA